MNRYLKYYKISILAIPLLLFFQTGCTSTSCYSKCNVLPEKQAVSEPSGFDQKDTSTPDCALKELQKNGNSNSETVLSTSSYLIDQQLLDSALDFCQASNDFWEGGDLDNALDALDQAFSLILKISPDAESDLLQQKEDLRVTISKRIIKVYSSRFVVANGFSKAIPLDMNAHVQKALTLFKGKEKKFFIRAYQRSGKYRPAIVKALYEAGLPEELSWLPLIESGFKVKAFSRARALGPWQFIASTGYKFGLKRDLWVDERMDPEKSTRAAIAYLKELHQIFGDWTTVLAAYNCGEGRVLRCIRKQKINYLDNFWDIYTSLPAETAFYVPKFLAVLHILNDPEAHDFVLPPVDKPIQAEHVSINKQVHLKTVAKHLDVPYSVLKNLNPELRHAATPNRSYDLKVPKGKAQVLSAKLDNISVWRPPVPAYVKHKIRKGETLSVLARRYGTSVRSIMLMNSLGSKRFIKAGWVLKIPTKRRYYTPSVVSTLPGKKTKASGDAFENVVRKGDSLYKIARRFSTTTNAIQTLNQLNGNHLQTGQALQIPKAAGAFNKMSAKPYAVQKGDSPYLIAQKHQMTLSTFLRLNSLTPRSTIFPGQLLLVKSQ